MDVERKRLSVDNANAEEILAVGGGPRSDSTHLLCLAPHGGQIELNTEKQALQLATDCDVPTVGSTAWIFRGFSGDRRANETWYTPSTDITPGRQYQLLDRIWEEEFYAGVSFHGYSNDGVLVGGLQSNGFKELVVSSIRDELPENIPVEIAPTPGEYAGVHDENILNRLAEHTVQIEQSMEVRQNYWKEVVGAVSCLYSGSL